MINPNVAALILKIRILEDELQQELDELRLQFNFTLHERKARFTHEVTKRHLAIKKSMAGYILGARPLILIAAPLIYSIFVPLVLLDLFITMYQACCFPVYGIIKVKRSDYLIFDRTQLGYLNAIEKFNCFYCSYANGLIAYVREITARTEQYWCPIKHAQRLKAAHEHYYKFSEFGDAERYHEELEALRKELSVASPVEMQS